MAHVERTGPFRGILSVEPLRAESGDVTAALDLWLENRLEWDDNFRRDWLWSHGRWKRPVHEILSLRRRRDALTRALALRSWSRLPRRFPVAIRLPNGPSSWQPAHEIYSAIRKGRPDAHITLLCPDRSHGVADCAFPDADAVTARRGGPYELYCTFSRSPWAGLEAIGTPLRIGVGQKRRFLTHAIPSADRCHLARFGLAQPSPGKVFQRGGPPFANPPPGGDPCAPRTPNLASTLEPRVPSAPPPPTDRQWAGGSSVEIP
jgi:hypothetical protein